MGLTDVSRQPPHIAGILKISWPWEAALLIECKEDSLRHVAFTALLLTDFVLDVEAGAEWYEDSRCLRQLSSPAWHRIKDAILVGKGNG